VALVSESKCPMVEAVVVVELEEAVADLEGIFTIQNFTIYAVH